VFSYNAVGKVGSTALQVQDCQFSKSPRTRSSRLLPQHNVLCDGERWHQHFMLVNHANAFFDGIMQARNFYRLVLDTNFPFIRLIKALQDIHECRFASAIFSQESVNFTSFQGKLT